MARFRHIWCADRSRMVCEFVCVCVIVVGCACPQTALRARVESEFDASSGTNWRHLDAVYTAVGISAYYLQERTPNAVEWVMSRLAGLLPPLPASAPLPQRVLARRVLVLLASWLAYLPGEMMRALLSAGVSAMECDDLAVADAGACLAEGIVGFMGLSSEVHPRACECAHRAGAQARRVCCRLSRRPSCRLCGAASLGRSARVTRNSERGSWSCS